ncbi:hypothetical protein [Microbispora sp. GKU 823]|uniref:hypothetical protein n=1 Tax=Microbispora sp. GKU 823 TaxID=1652100 RepID=UPI0009D53627|nr:hypothetical protein [Microbispora sp. GKU 823]OPG11331.1 hypothetical protein B1L11_20875 [Microbispora sp. GKU 823]
MAASTAPVSASATTYALASVFGGGLIPAGAMIPWPASRSPPTVPFPVPFSGTAAPVFRGARSGTARAPVAGGAQSSAVVSTPAVVTVAARARRFVPIGRSA